MGSGYTYKEYVASKDFYEKYSAYQRHYADSPRESDKVLIDLVRRIVTETGRDSLRVLDVGCSTGNLLMHLRRNLPRLELTGGDLMAYVVEECRANDKLQGIHFELMDILDIPSARPFDVIIANAVLYLFEDEQLDRIVGSVAKALGSGGHFLAFDFCHDYPQRIQIIEKSSSHPEGLPIHFRPAEAFTRAFSAHGFSGAEYHPFRIGIDLHPSRNPGEELNTFTRQTTSGERLLFRGALFQPWCHIVARKAAG
jgi:SAM-dependent methyltransferase